MACAKCLIDGYIGDWLMIAGWAKRWVDERLGQEGRTVPPEEYLRLVVDEKVRLQIKHVAHLSMVRKRWETTPEVPRLHGRVYDIATGLSNVLIDGRQLTR